MPAQPSSAIAFQVSRSNPSAEFSSRNLRSWEMGMLLAQKSLAVSLSMFCSSLSIIGMVSATGLAQRKMKSD